MLIRTMLLSLMLAVFAAPAARADDTTDQAVWLLQKSMLIHPDHRESVLLRALRQFKDPRLEPLFTELTQKVSPFLKIHGILGLGEIANPPHIDLALVADIKDVGTQAQLIGAAVDSDLLTTSDAEQLMKWPGLDPAVGVLVATQLVADKQQVDPAVLVEASKSSNDALRGMAAVLQVKLGQPDAINILNQISASDSPNRDRVRSLLLQTIMKYNFKEFAGWAMSIVDDKFNDDHVGRKGDKDHDGWRISSLGYQALRAALMFRADGAADRWLDAFKHTHDDTAESPIAERIRLSMLAVDIADQIDPRVFDAMAKDDMELVHQIGVVGQSLAAGKADVDAMIKLLQEDNALSSRWVLQWAAKTAEKDAKLARSILVAVIQSAESDEVRTKSWRLENAVLATQKIDEMDPDAVQILSALFKRSFVLTQEAMLMGLIRSTADHPEKVIEDVTQFPSPQGAAMALLLRAKHTDKLPPDQLDKLGLIVCSRDLEDPLRVQAAWIWLKLTGKDRIALATVLGGSAPRTP